jgi:hypothetical protein
MRTLSLSLVFPPCSSALVLTTTFAFAESKFANLAFTQYTNPNLNLNSSQDSRKTANFFNAQTTVIAPNKSLESLFNVHYLIDVCMIHIKT